MYFLLCSCILAACIDCPFSPLYVAFSVNQCTPVVEVYHFRCEVKFINTASSCFVWIHTVQKSNSINTLTVLLYN